MKHLRELRKEKGLTLKQLSSELSSKLDCKISADSLGKYERGVRKPKIDKLEALSFFFNVPLDYLEDKSDIRDFKTRNVVSRVKDTTWVSEYIRHSVADFLSQWSDYPVDKLSYNQLKTIDTLQKTSDSLITSLTEFESFKTLEVLKNTLKVLFQITSEYRLMYDNPKKFEKKVIPMINRFLFELEKNN